MENVQQITSIYFHLLCYYQAKTMMHNYKTVDSWENKEPMLK